MHCSMVSPCVIHPGNAGTVTVYPPSSVSGSRIIVYFRIIDSPLMYALFSHPLLMPIIPMGQLNRKGHKAVKIDDCGNESFIGSKTGIDFCQCCLQGFSNVALIGIKPPPQIKQERVAALALPRQSGNTLFSSFLGRGGEEGKKVLEALGVSAPFGESVGESLYYLKQVGRGI